MTAAKMHVKKGDKVLVLSGKDKGKEGKIIIALPKKSKVARNVNFHYTLTITRVAPPSDSTSTKLKCPTVRM